MSAPVTYLGAPVQEYHISWQATATVWSTVPVASKARVATCRTVGGDAVEVALAYDLAEITVVTAVHLVYTLVGLLALTRGRIR